MRRSAGRLLAMVLLSAGLGSCTAWRPIPDDVAWVRSGAQHWWDDTFEKAPPAAGSY